MTRKYAKPKKSQAITIAPASSLEGKAKPKMVDNLKKSTWMKIDDRSIDRDLGFNSEGKYLEVWE